MPSTTTPRPPKVEPASASYFYCAHAITVQATPIGRREAYRCSVLLPDGTACAVDGEHDTPQAAMDAAEEMIDGMMTEVRL